jgi:hypothetical protein
MSEILGTFLSKVLVKDRENQTERAESEEILYRVKEYRNIQHTIK